MSKHGGGPVVENGRSIDINDLIRSGMIRRGGDYRSSITWTHHYTGEQTHELVVEALLSEPERPFLRLIHRHKGAVLNGYVVWLTSTAQPFGGERLWFTCPATGDRVGTLHMPPGANRFASREAWGIPYRSQRSSPRSRACAKMHKMRRALGGEPNPLRPIIKPHRMRRATFDAKMARLNRVEARAIGFLAADAEALRRRLDRNAGQ